MQQVSEVREPSPGYKITILRPAYSEHGQGVDPDGRAYDLEDEATTVVRGDDHETAIEQARWRVAELIGRANWIDESGTAANWQGAFTPSERAEADDAITDEGGRVELSDGRVVEVVRS